MEGGVRGILIVLSAFSIQFLTFGFTAGIGVYNIELLDYFQGQTVAVSLVTSLNFGILLSSGPVVSLLLTHFSYKAVAMFGTTLTVVGLVGASLFPCLPCLCVFIGVLTGFGTCCAFLPPYILSGLYYKKYRSLSTGIATSGSGLGSAVMPIFVGYLIDVYSWKASLMVMAGVLMNCCVFSMYLRLPPTSPKPADKHGGVFNDKTDTPLMGESSVERKVDVDGNICHQVGESCSDDGTRAKETECGDTSTSVNASISGYVMTSNTKPENGPAPDQVGNSDEGHTYRPELSGTDEFGDVPITVQRLTLNKSVICKHQSDSIELSPGVGSNDTDGMVSDCVIQHSDHKEDVNRVPEKFGCENKHEMPKVKEAGKHNYSRHVYIFTSCDFNILFTTCFAWNIGASIVTAFAPELLTERGLTPMESAYIVSYFGMGTFIGGVLTAVVGNIPGVNRIYLYICFNVSAGGLLLSLPFGSSSSLYAFFLSTAGISFGGVLGLFVVVLADVIGEENLANGLGYLSLANGLGTFSGPPIAGVLRNTTSHFDEGIYFSGLTFIVAGLVTFLIPVRKRFSLPKHCVGKRGRG